MKISMPGLLALEVLYRDEEKKDSVSGAYKPTGVRIPHVVLYPFGQVIKFGPPQPLCQRIPDDRVGEITAMVGKRVTFECDARNGKNGNYYVFENLSVDK